MGLHRKMVLFLESKVVNNFEEFEANNCGIIAHRYDACWDDV